MKDNYLQPIINKMKWRIGQPDTETAKLAEIIRIAFEFRESILESDVSMDHDRQNVIEFTEVIVSANHRAHQILNGIDVPVEEEIESAIKEVEMEMNKKHGYTRQNRTEQED
jgi:hypothetical protein